MIIVAFTLPEEEGPTQREENIFRLPPRETLKNATIAA